MTESVGCELRTRPSTRTLTCCFLADRPKKEIDVGPPSWIRPLQLSGCAATVLASWIGFATCVLCSAPCFRAMDLTRARENSYMGTRRLCNFLRILADVYILAPRLHKAWPQAWHVRHKTQQLSFHVMEHLQQLSESIRPLLTT